MVGGRSVGCVQAFIPSSTLREKESLKKTYLLFKCLSLCSYFSCLSLLSIIYHLAQTKRSKHWLPFSPRLPGLLRCFILASCFCLMFLPPSIYFPSLFPMLPFYMTSPSHFPCPFMHPSKSALVCLGDHTSQTAAGLSSRREKPTSSCLWVIIEELVWEVSEPCQTRCRQYETISSFSCLNLLLWILL